MLHLTNSNTQQGFQHVQLPCSSSILLGTCFLHEWKHSIELGICLPGSRWFHGTAQEQAMQRSLQYHGNNIPYTVIGSSIILTIYSEARVQILTFKRAKAEEDLLRQLWRTNYLAFVSRNSVPVTPLELPSILAATDGVLYTFWQRLLVDTSAALTLHDSGCCPSFHEIVGSMPVLHSG